MIPAVRENHPTTATPANITAVFNNQASNIATSATQPIPATTQAPSQPLPGPITAVQEEADSPRPPSSAPATEKRSRRSLWGSMKKEPKKKATNDIDNPPTYEELEARNKLDEGALSYTEMMCLAAELNT